MYHKYLKNKIWFNENQVSERSKATYWANISCSSQQYKIGDFQEAPNQLPHISQQSITNAASSHRVFTYSCSMIEIFSMLIWANFLVGRVCFSRKLGLKRHFNLIPHIRRGFVNLIGCVIKTLGAGIRGFSHIFISNLCKKSIQSCSTVLDSWLPTSEYP